EFRLPLSSGVGAAGPGAERGFDLALPGSAVTTLTLDLPESVRELRWNKANAEKPAAPATEQKHWEMALGKITQLQVAWKEPRAAARVAVGPFSVQDALRQEGTIEVKLPLEARRGVRLTYHVGGSLEEREPPRDQPGSEVVAVFKYWDMPVPPKGAKEPLITEALTPPLEIELNQIQGKVETTIEHSLRLRPSEQGWQIAATCKIVARP